MHVKGINLHIKKEPYYKERDEEERAEFKKSLDKFEGRPLVYVDESGCDQYYHRDHARAPKGERVYGEVSGRRYARMNFIAGYCDGKALAAFEYNGTSNADLIEGWLETMLLPVTPKNAVIFMDNASFHNKENLFDIIECEESERTLVFC